MIDAMKQALEALDGWANHGQWVWPETALEQCKRNTVEAITALRLAIQKEEALSALIADGQALGGYDVPQAERQEPVAWMWKDGTLTIDPDRADETWTPLYTAPPLTEEEQRKNYWQNLTDAEHMQLAEEWGCMSADWVFYAAAIERKVKEKQSAWLESLIKEAQIASHAKRLALELESLLLATHDTEAVSTWWQSAYQAMHNYQDDVDRLYPQDHVSPLGKD